MSLELSPLQTWGGLAIAAMGTYACRALGVMASGKINQDSEFFRWLSAVTYALVSALVVRMILVPALMTLLGKSAWWIPKWLDKILPDVDVEGAKLERTHAIH